MSVPLTVAIFGNPHTCQLLREAATAEGCTFLDTSALEICDEWQTRRWFVDNRPNLVLIGMLGQPESSARELLLNTQGLINVLNASVGVTDRVRILSWFASNSYYLLRRLGEMLSIEMCANVSAQIVVGNAAVSKACVLHIRDVVGVQTKEEAAESAEGQLALDEVRDQVVPQSPGAKVERILPPTLLEMQIEAAQRAASRNLRPQRDPAAG